MTFSETEKIMTFTLLQFLVLDESGPVPVDALKGGLPLIDEVVQVAKLLKVDRAGEILVKHHCNKCKTNMHNLRAERHFDVKSY